MATDLMQRFLRETLRLVGIESEWEHVDMEAPEGRAGGI